MCRSNEIEVYLVSFSDSKGDRITPTEWAREKEDDIN